jgi:phosphoserine phosphatase
MRHVLTLVAANSKSPLDAKHLAEARKILVRAGHKDEEGTLWIEEKKAADVFISDRPDHAAIHELRGVCTDDCIDIFIQPAENRRKKLLLADMDSTIVTSETLDELAAFANLKEKISGITARAMEGEIDFKTAVRERVSLLRDLPVSALEETLAETRLSPGAQTFVRTMKKHGAACVLVSGGFTFFTGAVAAQAGFDYHHGNILNIENDRLTGTVVEPIQDRHSKVEVFERYIRELGLENQDGLTIGDGANDIPMLKKAGLGIGYKAKQAVADEIGSLIIHGDLTSALYAQGYSTKDITY